MLVAMVENNSPAWLHGLREGDVITAVNRKKVTTARELKTEIDNAGTIVALNILRGDTQLFIVVQ